jgi:hypothetical protein
VVDDRAEQVEQRRSIPSPMGVVVGKALTPSRRPDVSFQKLHDRREDHGAFAPAAQPAIAPENRNLQIL